MRVHNPLLAVAIAVGVVATLTGTALAIQNIYSANQQVTDVQVGSTPVNKVYVGSNLVWERAVPPAQGDPMTSLTAEKCAVMTTFTGTNTDAVIGMWDGTESGKYYAVAKLADNRCWMISNYAKASGANITNMTGAWTSTTGLTTAYYTDPSTATPLNGTRACSSAYATTAADAITYLADSGLTAASSIRNCGYIYNWYGATNGTGTSSLTSQIVTGSICPTGWHLPSSGGVDSAPTGWASTNETNAMYTAIGGTYAKTIGSTSAFRGVHAGSAIPGNFVYYQGSTGNLWSSSANSNANTAYNLYFNTSSVSPANNTNKPNGLGVRCVLNV